MQGFSPIARLAATNDEARVVAVKRAAVGRIFTAKSGEFREHPGSYEAAEAQLAKALSGVA